MRVRRLLMTTALVLAYLVSMGTPASPAPQDGTLTVGVHVTLVNRWLDPGETEALITPFMVLYALHDALVKPMPKNIMTPSLAESWTASKDGLSYDFVIRKNAKFHNGDPVTAEDVKFTFERYKGASAKILKDHVKEIQLPAPDHVRFVLREAWPDFMAFYGTSATVAGWIWPDKYSEKAGEGGVRTSWPSTAPRLPAQAGSCPRHTSRRSARTDSRRRPSERGPTSSSPSNPASSSCSRPSRSTGARRRA